MSQNLDDCEFWLPPKFLADDDTPFSNINNNKNGNKLFSSTSNDDVFNAVSNTLFPYYFTSPLASSETESDEEEQIAELTRQMTHSTLQHHKLALNNHNHHHHKAIFVNGSSPQPTRSAFENRSYGQGSNPNDTVLKMNSQRATLDLLRAAAGEVERMHQVNNDEGFNDFLPKKPFGFHTQNQQHSLSHQKRLQIAQFEMLRRQQEWLKQQEEIVRGSEVLQMRCGNYETAPNRVMNKQNVFECNVGLSPSAWCSLKNGSNAKTVFLGNSNNVKKERNGTGVFLPRFVDTQSRKKPACKTVVVPERVVQALNMKVEEGMIRGYMQQKNRFYGTSNIENGVARIGSDYGFTQQKRNMMPQQQQVNREIRLPQEWTY